MKSLHFIKTVVDTENKRVAFVKGNDYEVLEECDDYYIIYNDKSLYATTKYGIEKKLAGKKYMVVEKED